MQESIKTVREVSIDDINVIELETEEQAAEFKNAVEAELPLAIYIETDYHHPMWAKIKGMYFEQNQQVYHLPVGERASYRLEWMRPLLECADIPKYLHNAKYVQVLLMRYGLQLQGVVGDSLLAAYIDDPSFEGDDLATVKYLVLCRNQHSGLPSS